VWVALLAAGVVLGGGALALKSGIIGSDKSADVNVANVNAVVDQDAQPEGQPDAMAIMNAWMEAGTPDENHALLEAFAGDWAVRSVMTMVPGEPPTESEGREVNEMILGGRYLLTHHEGMFGEAPFEGHGVMGYDKIQKKWVSAWVDSFSTMIGVSTGTYDADTRTWTLLAEMKDPMGNMVQHKTLHTIVSDSERTLTFFERYSDDEEWRQNMIITYTRN